MKGILCFGDSITFGDGESPKIGWCGRLKQWFEASLEDGCVYNLGVGGQTSSELLSRFDTECGARTSSKQKDSKYLIIISIGTNDAKCDEIYPDKIERVKSSDFEANIFQLINRAKKYNSGLMFIGIPPVYERFARKPIKPYYITNERLDLFNQIIKKCCEQEKVPFLDINNKMKEKKNSDLLSDGIHPSSIGYDLMFGHIRDFIIESRLI